MTDTPLTVEVKDDELIIRIGVSTLAWAFEHSEDNNPFDENQNDFRQAYKVVNPVVFAKDVRRELLDEEEDGTTPLHLLLDEVCDSAVENGSGSLAVEECTDGKSAYARDYE